MAEKLNGTQQENLISILAHDDKNGKLVAQMANVDLFEGEYRVIAERCKAYWKKHGKAPKVHTADLVGEFLEKDHPKRRTYERILRNMERLFESINTEYVLRVLRDFTRLQNMKDAILKSAEQLNTQSELAIGEVETVLADLLRVREIDFDPGLRIDNPDKILDRLRQQQSEFRTGIAHLDDRHIVPYRGAVLLFLAPTGRGKTWFLIHIGKLALLLRKRVLHITLELDQDRTAQRYYQDLFSIPKHAGRVEMMSLRVDKKGNVEKFKRYNLTRETGFDTRNIRTHLHEKIKPFVGRITNLVIKRFPMRSLTMDMLRAYLDALEATEGFIPDMIILDYIGVTKTDVKNHRLSLGRVFEDFRAICTERNCAGVTAHQTSKISADARVVKSTHVAEDWSLIATSDVAVTYSQTEAERRLGLARLMVAKARDELDQFGVIITQSYALGQFVLQSAMLDNDYFDYVDDQTTADEREEERRSERDRERDDD